MFYSVISVGRIAAAQVGLPAPPCRRRLPPPPIRRRCRLSLFARLRAHACPPAAAGASSRLSPVQHRARPCCAPNHRRSCWTRRQTRGRPRLRSGRAPFAWNSKPSCPGRRQETKHTCAPLASRRRQTPSAGRCTRRSRQGRAATWGCGRPMASCGGATGWSSWLPALRWLSSWAQAQRRWVRWWAGAAWLASGEEGAASAPAPQLARCCSSMPNKLSRSPSCCPSQVALAAAPTGAVVDVLLEWIYLQQASFQGALCQHAEGGGLL